MEFRDRFIELRKEKGIGQNQLSKELGVSNAVISYWETGRNEPTLQLLKKICIYFDVTADYLIGLEDESGARVTNKYSIGTIHNNGKIEMR